MSTNDDLVRPLVIVLAFVLLIPFLMMIFAWPMMGMWGGGTMWDGGMWDGTGATWGWLVMSVVFLVLLIGGGYLLYRTVRQSDGLEADAALEELRLAYARGEISEEEYDERRSRLRRES